MLWCPAPCAAFQKENFGSSTAESDDKGWSKVRLNVLRTPGISHVVVLIFKALVQDAKVWLKHFPKARSEKSSLIKIKIFWY